MKYEILPNGYLRLFIPDDDATIKNELIEMREANEPLHRVEHDALEHLTCNSELDWIPEGTTADLTSAPMLGITGPDQPASDLLPPCFGTITVGMDGDKRFVEPVMARWCYMSYQVRSFIDDLIEKGECIWEGGFATSREAVLLWRAHRRHVEAAVALMRDTRRAYPVNSIVKVTISGKVVEGRVTGHAKHWEHEPDRVRITNLTTGATRYFRAAGSNAEIIQPIVVTAYHETSTN